MGLKYFWNQLWKGFEGESGVEKVICTNNKTVEADGVVVGVGILPNQEIAESAGLKCNNGILVDEYGRTEDPLYLLVGIALITLIFI